MDWKSLFRTLAPDGRKASAARRLIALDQVGRPVWSPRRFDAFADEGYRKNVIAFRAVGEVAQAAASVPWRLFRRAGGRCVEIAEHPLLGLLVRPNPLQAGPALLEAAYAFRLIAGNAFIEAVTPEGRPPVELYALRPDRMRVIAGAAGLPAAYRYTVGGRSRDFPVDQVTGHSAILHLRAFHPLDDWLGLSPLEAAAFAIDQHNQAGAWNQALLQNGARPSGALMVQGSGEGTAGTLSDEQFERLKGQIDELYTGARNAGRPVLLEGGLTWQEMSLSPKDMDFINAKHTAARDVALAFGVPPQLLGIPGDNTYSNMREARLALWEDTVLPLVRQLTAELNCWLAPRFGDGLELAGDPDEIPALGLRRERLWEKLGRADFLTVNEKRAAAGYGAIAGGDVLARPRSRTPARQDDDAAEPRAAGRRDQNTGNSRPSARAA
ncbi:MAG: phage portal protein [Alphaproteobacteria bacterium]